MRRLFCLLIVFSFLSAERSQADARKTEEAKLTAFFRNYLEENFRRRPMEATRLGDHRFDHLLDDLSPKTRAAGNDLVRQTLRDLARQVDYRKLSRPAQIDYEILRHDLTRSLWLAENTHPFEEDPRVYNEYTADSVYL